MFPTGPLNMVMNLTLARQQDPRRHWIATRCWSSGLVQPWSLLCPDK